MHGKSELSHRRRYRTAALGGAWLRNAAFVCALLPSLALAETAAAPAPAPTEPCEKRQPSRRISAYNANISAFPKLATVRADQLVEFNPEAMRDHAGYMRGIAERHAIPEWYWVGANCNKGADCSSLAAAKVPLGSTGTAEWNLTENRIYDLSHPAVIARAEKEMERALRAAAAAGSDLVFRIDNMHDLDDDRFYDTRHKRSFEELANLPRAWARVVARLRADGVLAPSHIFGLTAHNNFQFWTDFMTNGGAPPLLLRLENPTQFPADLDRGVALMQSMGLPMIAIEFKKGHLYNPAKDQIDAVAKRVSLLVLMNNEDNYQDGVQMVGPGPREIRGEANECTGPAAGK